MDVTLRFFAFQAEYLGAARQTLSLPEPSTVGDAVSLVRRQHPGLPWPAGTLLARNQAYADLNEALHAGDELAIIPPVSGG